MKTISSDNNARGSSKFLTGLFFLWLLTLPFGSKLASFSVGFMTLYPNLIIGGLFVVISIKQIVNWHKAMKWTSAFLILWLLYAVIFLLFSGTSTMGIFHVRILAMQVLFAFIIFNATSLFGWADCRKLLIGGLKTFLNLLIVVGLFEVISGIHEFSVQTAKLLDLEVSKVFYAPMFVFENQNDFICYALFLLLILIVLDSSFRISKFKILFYAVAILFFSFVSDSTFGFLASIGIIGITLAYQYLAFKVSSQSWIVFGLTTVFLSLTIMQTPLFYGPIFSSYSTYVGNREVLIEDSLGNYTFQPIKKAVSPEVLMSLQEAMKSGKIEGVEYSSTVIRKNLIFNGIEFIKEQPIIGIGPGNFVNRLDSKKGYYPTGTVHSPHNFVIEIVSQYGLIGWTYLLILLFLFLGFIRKAFLEKIPQLLFIIGVFPILGILWLMPSSYLYLDINWLFLPIMICSYFYFSKDNFENNVDHIK